MVSIQAYSGVANPIKLYSQFSTENITNASGNASISTTINEQGIISSFIAFCNETSAVGLGAGDRLKFTLLKNDEVLSSNSLYTIANSGIPPDLQDLGVKFYEDLKFLTGSVVQTGDKFTLLITNGITAGGTTITMELSIICIVMTQPKSFIIP